MFEHGTGNPIIMWKPVIEPDFGQERFLTENPTESFRTGNFARVPIIAGITQYEFLHPAMSKSSFYSYNLIEIQVILFLHSGHSKRKVEKRNECEFQ